MIRPTKVLTALLVTVSTLVSVTSCRLKGEAIGDLYGRWHLHSISNSSGLICEPDTVYISFMATVYQYQPKWKYDWGTFERTADSITLNPLAYMSEFGFYDLMLDSTYNGLQPISFRVRSLNDYDMYLERTDTIWHFHKFLE